MQSVRRGISREQMATLFELAPRSARRVREMTDIIIPCTTWRWVGSEISRPDFKKESSHVASAEGLAYSNRIVGLGTPGLGPAGYAATAPLRAPLRGFEGAGAHWGRPQYTCERFPRAKQVLLLLWWSLVSE
jgi:hypothetical protein